MKQNEISYFLKGNNFYSEEKPKKIKYIETEKTKMKNYMMKKIEKKKTYSKIYSKLTNSKPKEIFQSLTFIFNGVTGENELYSEYHLTKISLLYGAKVLTSFASQSNATHIICNKLPKLYKRNKNVKYTHPNWIFDSIKNGSLLNLENYLIK
jgi:hypothetical protein